MARPVTLFTGQWADFGLAELCEKAKSFGYDGLELACWGDHIEVHKADQAYCDAKKELLASHGLQLFSISNHLVGQAVCDNIDERHQAILPPHIWGDGDPEGVRQRAAEEMIETGRVAKRLGLSVVNGFTGSSIWHLLYSFPPASQDMIQAGFEDFAKRWIHSQHSQKIGLFYPCFLALHCSSLADRCSLMAASQSQNTLTSVY